MSSGGKEEEEKFWLYAFRDHMARLKTYDNSICTADVNHNGDYKLLIADGSKQLKVYGGTSLLHEYKLAGVPSCITSFYMQDNEAESIYPVIAVGVGSYVFMFRNDKPLYRFALPKVEIDEEEIKLWGAFTSGELTLDALLTQLRNRVANHNELCACMRELLLFDNSTERNAFVERRRELPLEELDTVTCMGAIGLDHAEESAVNCLLVGTERKWVYMIQGPNFDVRLKVQLASTPVRFFVMGCVRVEYKVLINCRDGFIYTIKNNSLRNYVIRPNAPPTAITQYDNLLAIATTRAGPEYDSFFCTFTPNTNEDKKPGSSVIDVSINDKHKNTRSVKTETNKEFTINTNLSAVKCSTTLSYYTLKGSRKEELTIGLPSSVTQLATITDPVTKMARAIIVALANGELRVYVERVLRHVSKLYGLVTSMCYSRYGREDSALITVMQNGTLLVQLLHRKANLSLSLEESSQPLLISSCSEELKPPCITEESESLSTTASKLALRKKGNATQVNNKTTNKNDFNASVCNEVNMPELSLMFTKQTFKEIVGAVNMFRSFQLDLCRLRLTTAKTFLKALVATKKQTSLHKQNSELHDINILNIERTYIKRNQNTHNTYTWKQAAKLPPSTTTIKTITALTANTNPVKKAEKAFCVDNKQLKENDRDEEETGIISHEKEVPNVNEFVYLARSKYDDNMYVSCNNKNKGTSNDWDNREWNKYNHNKSSESTSNTDNTQISEDNEKKRIRKPISFNHPLRMSTVKMTIKRVGTGPSFRLQCNITNETSSVLYNLMLVFECNHALCQMPRSTFAISYLCPWQTYNLNAAINLSKDTTECALVTATLIAGKRCTTEHVTTIELPAMTNNMEKKEARTLLM